MLRGQFQFGSQTEMFSFVVWIVRSWCPVVKWDGSAWKPQITADHLRSPQIKHRMMKISP